MIMQMLYIMYQTLTLLICVKKNVCKRKNVIFGCWILDTVAYLNPLPQQFLVKMTIAYEDLEFVKVKIM